MPNKLRIFLKRFRFLTIVSASLFSATLFLVLIAYHTSFQIAWMYEFSSYADIGRNLSKSHTFTTNFVTPMDLAYLEQKNLSSPPWPMTYRFPLFPVLLGFVFSIFGVSDVTVVWTNGIIFAIFIVCIYLLGRLIFSRPWYVSLIASIIAAITPTFWHFALWGYGADFLFGILLFLHFGILSLLLAKPETIRPRHFVWLSILGFLAYLARYNYVLYLPAIVSIVLLRKFPRKAICLAYYLGVFWGLVLAHGGYSCSQIGSSESLSFTANLAHLSQTASLPWLDYRTVYLKDLLPNHLASILKKGSYLFFMQLRVLLGQFGHNLLVPFTICACIFSFPKIVNQKRIFAQIYLVALLIHVLFFSFLRIEPLGRYLVWLTPFTLLHFCAKKYN